MASAPYILAMVSKNSLTQPHRYPLDFFFQASGNASPQRWLHAVPTTMLGLFVSEHTRIMLWAPCSVWVSWVWCVKHPPQHLKQWWPSTDKWSINCGIKAYIFYKESWEPKNGCFWTVLLDNTLESPLDCKEIQPVHPKGDQSWVFIGRTDVEAETPILWPPHAKSWLIWKDPDARKDWGQEEKGTTEDEMVGWHHRLNEHELE